LARNLYASGRGEGNWPPGSSKHPSWSCPCPGLIPIRTYTVSMISPSYDIKMNCINICRNGLLIATSTWRWCSYVCLRKKNLLNILLCTSSGAFSKPPHMD
jgi:hypothetical protein